MTLAQLGTFTLEASVVLAAALAAVGLLSRTSAPVRHWVLAVAVCGSLALPLLETLLPAWRIAPAATAVSLDGTDAAEAVVVDERFVMPLATGSASTTESPRRAARWRSLAMPVWLTGVLVGSVIMLAGLARLRWLARHAEPVTHGPWAECWCDLARADRAIPAATLLQSTHGSLLVTWGWTPKILLPADAAGWDRPRIEAVLSHEAAHIRRHDWFLQLSADVLRTLLWFNPLAWIAAARLRLESERACDDAVLASGIAPPEYASHLVDIARTLSRSRTWAPAPGMARTSSLERRVSAMLDTQVSRRPLTRFLRFAVTVPLVALTASIASFAAQTSFATLSGTVRDPLGGTIPGVTLTLAHAQSGARHEVRTDQRGSFEFVGLVAGNYDFEVKRVGFTSLRDTLQLAAGQTHSRHLRLDVGSLQETITVRDSPPSVAAPLRRPRAPESTAACAAAPNSGSLTPPRKTDDKRPFYPGSMRGTGIAGRVVMTAVIGTDGAVREVRTLSATNADFDQAAQEAVRQWRFTQTLLNCVPIEVQMTVTATFDPNAVPPPPPPPPPPVPPAA